MPSVRPWTAAMLASAAASSVSSVPLCDTTTIAPSAERVSTAASVTGSSGGASMITIASRARSLTRVCMAFEPRSSLGLGGIAPDASTRRPGTSGWSWMTSSGVTRPTSTSVRPAPSTMANESATVGRRRSPSIRVTVWPPMAIAAARLAATVDLPSDCLGLVTTMTRGGWSTSM